MRYELENRCPHYMPFRKLNREERLTNLESSLFNIYKSIGCERCRGYDSRCELNIRPIDEFNRLEKVI